MASSTSSINPLNFSINFENKCLSNLWESYCKNCFILLASRVFALSLSSRYYPHFPVLANDILRSSALPLPGMTNLKLLACPRVILSRWFSCIFLVVMAPLTKSLASWFGYMKILPFSFVIVQCLVIIPNAFSLIWLSSPYLVPILVAPLLIS